MPLKREVYKPILDAFKPGMHIEYTLPPKTNGATRKFLGYFVKVTYKKNGFNTLKGQLFVSDNLVGTKPGTAKKISLASLLEVDGLEHINLEGHISKD